MQLWLFLFLFTILIQQKITQKIVVFQKQKQDLRSFGEYIMSIEKISRRNTQLFVLRFN